MKKKKGIVIPYQNQQNNSVKTDVASAKKIKMK